jgi:hypothetical protein
LANDVIKDKDVAEIRISSIRAPVMLGNISDFNFSQLTGKTKLGAIG